MAAKAAPIAAPVVDEWATLSAFTADGFKPTIVDKPVSATVAGLLGTLNTAGKIVVATADWDEAKVRKFLRTIKSAPSLVGGRRINAKAGTVDGKAGLLLTLGATDAEREAAKAARDAAKATVPTE